MKRFSRLFLVFLLTFLMAGCGRAHGALDSGAAVGTAEAGSGFAEDGQGDDREEAGGGEEASDPSSGDASDPEENPSSERGSGSEEDPPSERGFGQEEASASERDSGSEEAPSSERSPDLEESSTSEIGSDEEESEALPSGGDANASGEDAYAGEDGEENALPEDGTYTTKEDVALYLHLYGHLPSNFITKKEAENLGWEGGSLEPYAPGKCIGGNRFGNYEGLLPEAEGRFYTECDIDTLGARKRGAKRIVFSNDGLIYYTEDHYESFELLYGEE